MTIDVKQQTEGVLAITHLDFYTAKRILLEEKCIDYAISSKDTHLPTDGKVYLLQNMKIAAKLKPLHGNPVVFIVCLGTTTATFYGMPIIDTSHGSDLPTIDTPIISEYSRQAVPLHIPLLNIDKTLIHNEIVRLQQTQILSYYNTFLYAMPKSARETVQREFLLWLSGVPTVTFAQHVRGKVSAKASDVLETLITFMSSERGKYYQKIFGKIFKGEIIEHDLPMFEINYMMLLKDRLGDA